jgi:CheY-like chemotaxis protein
MGFRRENVAMSVSVLVVDDSPMARKMLIRALPSTWDIGITQAASGVEALAAYRAGRVDVMFLDLTMPEMDGYQVLETLRREDLNCLVIVVSADVQEKAQQRVLELGAIAFIKKPVDSNKVESVLREYGIHV